MYGYHWKNHSESGWINDELFQDYLMHLREYFPDDDELHLILDIYKAHLTDNVKAMAEALNIKLHFIPAGMTDLYQPLDRNIFGPFKAIARRLFREHNYLGEPIEISTTDACKRIICAWEKVSEKLGPFMLLLKEKKKKNLKNQRENLPLIQNQDQQGQSLENELKKKIITLIN